VFEAVSKQKEKKAKTHLQMRGVHLPTYKNLLFN
jgi:hypothetical protein